MTACHADALTPLNALILMPTAWALGGVMACIARMQGIRSAEQPRQSGRVSSTVHV